jgi:putative ABC transport system permease protein
MIAIGTLVGVIIALASGVLVSRFLYGVSAANPWIAAASVAILFAVGLAASVIPARRAALLDPMLSLRSE